jgi:nitrite reductase/ring-hydroxylating ferredoxin subunit
MTTGGQGGWREVASVAEFAATDRKRIELGGPGDVALFRVGDEFFAVGAWCSHGQALLVEGDVGDHEITCALHGARFCLRTGKNLSLPAVRPIARYEVKVEGGKVFVKL